jgi:protein phosphatase
MIPAGRAHLHVAAVTHPGQRGKSNEDRFAVSAHRLSRTDPTPSLLAIVADGVGGHRAGEVAAEMAVETISRLVSESDASRPAHILSEALARASQLIFEQSHRDLAQVGMGTTAVCAWIIGNHLYSAAAGDSRLYLLRNSALQRLTTDHTWVQEALDHGVLSPDQARDHPNAHVIRRYLGSKHPLHADLRIRLRQGESNAQAESNQGMRLLPGDRLLLCSDGLTDLVEDTEILAALSTGNSNQEALNGLVDLANARGGHDNITILTLEMPPKPIQSRLCLSRRRVLSCLVGGAILLAVLLMAAGVSWILLRDGGLEGSTSTPQAQPTSLAPTTGTPIIPAETSATPLPPASPTPSVPASATLAATTLATVTQPAATYTPWPTHTRGP